MGGCGLDLFGAVATAVELRVPGESRSFKKTCCFEFESVLHVLA
jgi:hypothetical protein